jgi:hypothetical protein
MAEFKLGRIRFVWKDVWVASTLYYKDDVVRFGGRTYICQIGHTSNQNFYTDLDYSPSRWNQLTDGQSWKGDWTTDEIYVERDIVKYGGLLYICNESHTSASNTTLGLEADQSKWDLFAEGLDWKGSWTTSFRYKVNDLVKYGGKTFVCNEHHTSASNTTLGLEADQSKWDEFNNGIEYRGLWNGSSIRYRVNDVVKYGSGLWICVEQHTSSINFTTDSAKWNQFVNGFEFENDWNISSLYQYGDVVRYGGNQYVAVVNSPTTAPTSNSGEWNLFTEGFNFLQDWNINVSYRPGDVVRINGFTYLATADSPSVTKTITATTSSPDSTFTTSSTAGLVEGMAIRFSGSTFGDVFPGATYYIKTIVNGTTFTVSILPDDTVTFVPTAATGSMTATAAPLPPNNNYWQILNSGINWQGEWTDDREYFLGDAVRFGANAYICVKPHRSESDDGSTIRSQGGGNPNSAPNLDFLGVYWNVLSIGSEISVLTTPGDLVYYGGSGPTRLPIGHEGQILRAGTEYPEWVTLGETDNLYFVAPHGQDLPAPIWGKTWDKPFKSIRYACEQVEKGARNPDAQRLLELNRVFVQREVTAWIRHQIVNDIAPFSTTFVYDDFKCERDVGFIIDRLIHDLGQGGNLKIRAAVQTFLNALDDGPFSKPEENNGTGPYNNLAVEAPASSAAYKYMLSLLEDVLANESPSTIYQNVTDDSSAIATQYKDFTLNAENKALEEIRSLVGFITTAFDTYVETQGDDTAKREAAKATIPTRYVPNKLIRVATGRYRETLPIIVPAYTCVQGDELRSTNAGPSGSLIDISDSYYTVSTFDHVGSIVNGIVLGASVTPTTGNTEIQSQEFPFADTTEASAVEQLVNVMKYQSDFRLGTLHTTFLTDPTNFNTSFLNGHGNARKLLKENKKFLQEETVRFLEINYPTLKYGKTKTRRDAGYIIDAVIYDLTYGGNALSIKAGLAYFDGDDDSQPQIPDSIKQATLDSQNFLKLRMMSISTDVLVVPLQTNIPQFRDTAGSTAARNFIESRVNEIISIVTNGPQVVGSTVNLSDPGTAWVDSNLVSAYSTLSSAFTSIGEAAVDYINSNFGDFTYNGAICRRDAGFLVDAGYFDAAFGSNFWGVQNGISYFRRQSSVVLEKQREQEIESVKFIKTQVAESLISNSTAVNRANSTYDEIVDILTNGVTAADALVFTDPGTDADATVARQQLVANRAFIISEITSWITAEILAGTNPNFVGLVYDTATCERDIGYSVDALCYDVQYGGNIATRNIARSLFNNITGESIYPANQKGASADTYDQLGVIAAQIVRGTYTGQNGFGGSDAGATKATLMNTLTGYISAVINADSLSGLVAESLPSITWVDAGIVSALSQLSSDKTSIVKATLQFITDEFNTFKYSHAKAERDAIIVLKSVGYDFMFNSNYQTIKSAHAYLRGTASEIFANPVLKAATRGALQFAASQAVLNVNSNATAISRINSLMQIVDDIIFGGENEGDVCQTEIRNRDYAVLQLERNRNFIISEVEAYIAETFKSTVTATTASTNVITTDDTSWMRRNTAIRLIGTGFGGLLPNTVYYIQNVISSTSFTLGTTRYATSPITLTTSSGSLTIELVYNKDLCLRDVGTYIDALKWDLKYTSNYKSRFVSRYYANAVLGSLEEDMYYLRDGTGLRDQTLEGLSGDLTPPNEYGTSRTTAGAYASLDPGWGPDDFRTWILSRSPYVQGLTTFGNAAIGQKIDGALHNGGNDSIVSNDFTQVISDGIGAYITNNGRAELVSVFTYYSHVGYLAENGGRIRGTNGNCSYGEFGAVAEGFDATETPNTAVVDNRFQFKATIENVITNGSQMLAFEFGNAGIDYSKVTYTLLGGGTNANVDADEFRDDGVFEVRLLDFGDDSSGQFGGDGYLTNSNTAQGGTSSSITLAATDPEVSTAYIGMKVLLTGGAGAGQFGIITTYNSGTKLATVIRESDGSAGWDHVVPGTTIVTPDASTTYIVEPTISFSQPPFNAVNSSGLDSGDWQNAVFGETSETYSSLSGIYSGSTGSGATFSVIRNGWKYTALLDNPGSNYQRSETVTILGTDLGGLSPQNDLEITIIAVNSITGAILEFEIDGFGISGRFVAVKTGSTQAAYSNDGLTWSLTAMPGASGNWTGVAHGIFEDGSTEIKVNRFVAVKSGTNLAAWSADGITWNSTILPTTANWSSVAFGNGRFVAVSTNSTIVAISLDGEVWDITGTISAGGFAEVTYGKGLFVAVRNASTVAATSPDGVTWTDRTIPSAAWTSVTYGNNRFVAVASDTNTAAYSLNGTTWTSTTIPSVDSSVSGFQKVRYGQGLFMATSYLASVEDYSFVTTSSDGLVWESTGIPGPANNISGYRAIAFGNPQRSGSWVVIQRDTGSHSVRIKTGSRAKARATVSENKIFLIKILEPGSGYTTAPIMTIVDPNNTFEAPFQVRTGKGVLANPSFVNRGNSYVTGNAEVDRGDGYADFYQPGSFIAVRRITQRPVAGSNVVFDDIPGTTFKVVNVITFLGQNDGAYTAFFQVSPPILRAQAPEHLSGVTTRIRYSQVRLTGHDFLDVGTGGFVSTNYPGLPFQDPQPDNETVENNGGRVFFTATDQDGNFRVGNLFAIEQSTGIATLNADAFNISGLQELNLGNVTLGGGSATITEFSTDPFFTADSDNIVPTQRAIKAFIASQIGGGGASLNVNSVTAGSIRIDSNQITNITGSAIQMRATFEFKGGVIGVPIAWNYFLT